MSGPTIGGLILPWIKPVRTVSALLACCAVVLGQASSGISIDRGDVQRTGVYATGPVVAPGESIWRSDKLFEIDRSPRFPPYPDILGRLPSNPFYYLTPVEHDGVIYFSLFLGDGYLFAVDTQTGKLKWKSTRKQGWFGPPTIVGNTLFVASNRLLAAIDLETQRELWSVTPDGPMSAGVSLLVAKGMIYAGGADGRFYAWDAANGARKWVVQPSGDIPWRSAVFGDGKIICANTKGLIAAWDPATGRELWKKTVSSPVVSLLLNGQTLFYVNFDRSIVAIDSNSGASLPGLEHKHSSSTQLAAAGGKLYFGGGDAGSIFAIDERTGSKVWKFEIPKYCKEPAIAGTTIYVTCMDQKVYALDLATGKKLWSRVTGQTRMSAPVIADGALYFIADDGKVHAVK